MTNSPFVQRLCTLCGTWSRRSRSRPAAFEAGSAPGLWNESPAAERHDLAAGGAQSHSAAAWRSRMTRLKAAAIVGALGLGGAVIVAGRSDSDEGAKLASPVLAAAGRVGAAERPSSVPGLLPHQTEAPRALVAGRPGARAPLTLAQYEEDAPAPDLDLDELSSPFDTAEQSAEAPAPPAEPPADVPRVVRALEESQPELPRDKPVSFHFRSAPWELVLTKFAEHVGVPIEMEVVPPGTLTHHDPRTFTPAEALHVLNHLMRPTGCGILQDGHRLVVSDLRRLSASPEGQPAPAPGSVPSAVAQMQVKMAKIDLNDGRVEAAHDTARQAAQAPVSYGLFEDRPDALLRDIERRRAAADLVPAPEPPAALPKAPAVTAAAAQTQPPAFALRPAPWGTVLEQYAAVCGMTLAMADVPPGDLSVSDARPLSPSDAFDVLNGHLFPRGYFLFRDADTLTVVKLSEGIPRRLIREAQPHELAAMGRSELACVVLAVPDHEAERVEQHVRPALGPLGGIERLQGPTRLRVIDTAGNLHRVAQSLQGAFTAGAAPR